VEPSSAEDVALIIQEVVAVSCHFAIKSGGHSGEAGFSNAEGGITLDLQLMNSIDINEDGSLTEVGAGAKWGQVYLEVEKRGLSVVGGRDADVGVGGLILGGKSVLIEVKRPGLGDGNGY
jgi:FAD/FMN-containing dehydrogenase